jgi:hypothetical protein
MASSAQPRANPGRYLYERLGDKRFQELANALLVHEYPGGQIQCFPVGQSDGGRDAVRRHDGRTVIYQVKWSSNPIRNPVAWLEGAIKGEAARIKELVEAGADQYVLITSLHGTAVPGRGTMDRLAAVLEQHSQSFGIPLSCWWRSDIDVRVDNAPRELKWAYSEMLAGNDAIRYLIEADRTTTSFGGLKDLVLKVVAAQEKEDARVKFKRVELDVYNLADLFVDVEAQRIRSSRGTKLAVDGRGLARPQLPLGGAARYLLNASQSWTLVTGEPGQGKSTLGQYVCQVHRHALLGSDDPRLQPSAPPNVRVPLRIDLRDYASWLAGSNPFKADVVTKSRKQLRVQGAMEQFLIPFIEARSGGLPCDIDAVHEILNRFPMLIVLDGLDEVAQPSVRERVAQEIDAFAARLAAVGFAPQVVVTTRPNASGLAEPSGENFEAIVLLRLSPDLRVTYLRKWADVNNVRGSARRALERTFRERTAEPHISLLADNPMQLSILLYLIHKRGDSVPTGRTALYTSYMETLLDREGEKTRAIVDHRSDLEEVTSYLGWLLQARAEAGSATGRLAIKALKKAILDYLFDVDKKTELVDDLFTTVTQRVWALTSKLDGTFEFDVQPVREYFAARFMHEFAGADSADFDASDLLRELVRRPYWLNTCRFYVGFANPNELAGLIHGLSEEFAESDHPLQVRSATWTLLVDGVFAGRTRAQRDAVRLLTDDLSIVLLRENIAKADMPKPTEAHGGEHLVHALRTAIEADPKDPLTRSRLEILWELSTDSNSHLTWWYERMIAALGTESELHWLKAGAVGAAGSRLAPGEQERISLDSASVRALVNSGAVPQSESNLERELIHSILNGQCSDCNPDVAGGYVGDLLRLIAPAVLLRKASGASPFALRTGHHEGSVNDSRRTAAIARLKKRDARFGRVQTSLRFKQGEKGSTFPWANTANEVAAIFGPCWLAAEIAIIGAAADPLVLHTGSSLPAGSSPFGPDMNYGALLSQLRSHRGDGEWWLTSYQENNDPLSRATWALALLCVADESVLRDYLATLESVIAEMDEDSRYALVASSSRIGASGSARRILPAAPSRNESLLLTVLLSHHSVDVSDEDHLPSLSVDRLTRMSEFGIFGWPAARALSARVASSVTDELLTGVRAFGHAAQVEITAAINNVPSIAATVLSSPKEFPADFVIAIESALSRSSEETALAAVASIKGWFGEG